MATDKLINSTQGDDIIDKLDDIAGKIHNVNYGLETTSAGVVQMAGYQKSSETTPGAISQGDTLNQAMGKLEKRIDNDETALAGKQATLTAEQLAAVNSGIDSTKVGQIATNQSDISSLQANTVPNTRTINSKDLSSDITLTAADVGAIATTAKGANGGVAELDANGKVPSAQLPSYVDDVLEYSSKSSFPATGETGKIYVDTSDNKTYRWGGSTYVEISASLALGDTASTAYYGDKGKTAYDHATESGRLTTATASGLYKVASTAQGHIASLTPVAKSDITGLGIPGTDTNTHRPIYVDGDQLLGDNTTALNIAAGNNVTLTPNTSTGVVAISAKDTNTHRPIQVNGTQVLGDNTTALNLKAGSNVSITNSSGTVTIAATDTTYSNATTTAAGLMSSTDKSKLDGIASGAQVNSITGVKGNSEQTYRTGNVNLTAANIGAASSSHTHNYAGSSSAGGAATSAIKLKIKSVRCTTPKAWITKSWSGLTKFSGSDVWTDGTNIYYSGGSTQRVFTGSSWTTKTWSGLTSFTGSYVWTDGTNIYMSGSSSQYVLSGSTWSAKTWSGYTSIDGTQVWTDGKNIYYSYNSNQYVLSGSTWSAKTWSGLTSFLGYNVWSDGVDIYYSSGSSQYVLNKSTNTWTTKTWTGLTNFDGTQIWTDGTNIYYSSNSSQYVLNGSTWIAKSWSGLQSFLGGSTIWTDGTNVYYSNNSAQYVLNQMRSLR